MKYSHHQNTSGSRSG